MKRKQGNLETLTIRIEADVLYKLKAYSYYRRSMSQRMVVEDALADYFNKYKEELNNAIEIYESLK